MCGIAAYLGPLQAAPVLLVALERLKYRGYDSAGLALINGNGITVRKSAGRLQELEETIGNEPTGTFSQHCGIAHTRWATHGPATQENAHPHYDEENKVAVVHNGIIENHEELRQELQNKGVDFTSQTDTEVIPHLLQIAYKKHSDPLKAVTEVASRLRGSYAFVAIFHDREDELYALREGSPLLLGRGHGKHQLLASDVPAMLPHAEELSHVEDQDLIFLKEGEDPKRYQLQNDELNEVEVIWENIELAVDDVSKGDFDSFMAKEIAEQPEIIDRIISSRIHNGQLTIPDYGVNLAKVQHFVFLACGTSWHAALLGKRFLEQFARVHVEVDISSEYRYRNPVLDGNTVVIPISQSGETADTLASLRLARSLFIPVISLVNVVDSTIARESDGVMPLLAGPEIGVASTKAYTAQIIALYLFSLQVAQAKNAVTDEQLQQALSDVQQMPQLIKETLEESEDSVREAAEIFSPAQATVFLGRSGEHVTAVEGALKLKEIAYVHAMGYAAGEFKHGPIALVTESLPVVCMTPQDSMYEKMLSNLEEVRARSGRIIAVGDKNDDNIRALSDFVFPVKRAPHELLQPVLSILPLQRYSYHVAKLRDCDVDQPRNLAKSVTVE